MNIGNHHLSDGFLLLIRIKKLVQLNASRDNGLQKVKNGFAKRKHWTELSNSPGIIYFNLTRLSYLFYYGWI